MIFDGTITCETQKEVDLSSKVNPLGGSFEGKAMAGTIFYPQIAGLGDWPIIYKYTNGFGCSNSKVGFVKVVSDLSEDIIGPDTSICNSAFKLNLYELCEVKEGVFEGEGIIDSFFYPSQVSPGPITINYKWERECTVYDEKTITIIESPEKPNILGKAEGCEEEIIRFTSGQQAEKYLWLNNSGQSLGTDPTIEITLGNYNNLSLRLKTTNKYGCGSMDYGKIEIKTFTPHGEISSSLDSIILFSEIPVQFKFEGVGEETHSYLWTWKVQDKSSSSFQADPFHYFQKSGYVKTSLNLTSKEGCKNTIEKDSLLFVVEPIGVKEFTKEYGIKIGPNPTTDEIFISFTKEFQGVISVNDITGRKLKKIPFQGKTTNFNFALFQNGVYFISFETKISKYITRISKTN